MGGVFINYRRGETAGEARALYNELSTTLGDGSVFMDVDNIALGRDFREVLNERLKSVDVMLALIGKDWVHATTAAGTRRLDDPNDFVRREIRAALERNIAVTPVLLQGAQMPAETELPEDIRDLAFRNGFELSHTRWASDVHELLKRLGLLPSESHSADTRPLPVPPASPAPPPAPAPAPRRGFGPVLAVLALLVAAGGGAYLYLEHDARVQRALAQAEAERRQARLAEQQARAAAEAASMAAAQAQRERAEAEARAAAAARQRALAEEQARQRSEKEAQARAAAEQRAAESAARAQRQQAEREQAQREQAQREQAMREQAQRDQAQREQAEREQAARAAAARSPSADMEQRMADVRRGKFSGSLGISLGDFALLRNIAPQELTAQSASPACGKFAEQVPPAEARNFRAVCLWLPEYASRNRMRLGVRASSQQWMAYCNDRADYVRAEGDARRELLGTCLRYR